MCGDKDTWPSNSCNLNAIDYSGWAILEKNLVLQIDQGSALVTTWDKMTPEQCVRIVNDLPKSLNACVEAKAMPYTQQPFPQLPNQPNYGYPPPQYGYGYPQQGYGYPQQQQPQVIVMKEQQQQQSSGSNGCCLGCLAALACCFGCCLAEECC